MGLLGPDRERRSSRDTRGYVRDDRERREDRGGGGRGSRAFRPSYSARDGEKADDSSRANRVHRNEKRRVKPVCERSEQWIVLVAFFIIAYRAYSAVRLRIGLFNWTNQPFAIPLHPADAAVVHSYSGRLSSMSVEIFSAPKPFIGPDRALNRRAIESWLKLQPRPAITLLGNEIGYAEAAAEYGLRHEVRVDKTFMGVPLFNSMIERANQSEATVTVVINGDILLFDDFQQTMRKVVASFENFLVIGARYDIDELPESNSNDLAKLRTHVVETGRLHTYGGMDCMCVTVGGR
jgi:hypothetical protein